MVPFKSYPSNHALLSNCDEGISGDSMLQLRDRVWLPDIISGHQSVLARSLSTGLACAMRASRSAGRLLQEIAVRR